MKLPARWMWIAFGVLLVGRLGLACIEVGPRQLDELGYVANARHLATGVGDLEPAGRAPYKIGYSLLLVPAFWLTENFDRSMLVIRLLNALLMSLLLPLAATLAGRLDPDLEPLDRLLVGAAIALSPAAVLYGTTAMSENVLLPGYLLYILCGHRALMGHSRLDQTQSGEAPSSRFGGGLAGLSGLSGLSGLAWAAWGSVAGYLYLVHERAIGWLALALVASVVAAVFHRRIQPLILGLVALPLAKLTDLLAMVNLSVPGASWPTGRAASDLLMNIASRPITLLATVVGQAWYVCLATLGLLFAGLWLVVQQRPLWRSSIHWLIALSAASMTGLSILSMGQRDSARMTHWLYGRYNESVLPVLMILALLALFRAHRKQLVRAFLLTASLLVVAPLILRLLYTPEIGRPYAWNVPALGFYEAVIGWGLLRAAALSLLGFGLLAVIFLWRRRAGLAVFAAWQLIAALVGYFDADWSGRGEWRPRERHIARLVTLLAEEGQLAQDIVCYDSRPFPHFQFYHYDFFLSPIDLELIPANATDCGGGELWITPDLDSGPLPDARLVALETLPADYPPFAQRLWVAPGSLQDELLERGWLLPRGFPAALDAADLHGSLRFLESGGEPKITLTHLGDAPWPHLLGLRQLSYRVALRVTWHDLETRASVASEIVELPHMIFPGEQIEVVLPVHTSGPALMSVQLDQYLVDRWADLGPSVEIPVEATH